MKYFMLTLLLLFLSLQIWMKKIPKIKGIEQDPAFLKWYDIQDIKLRKYNKTTLALSGKFIIKRQITNIKYSLKLGRKVGSSYLPIPLVTVNKADYCSFLENPHIRPMMEDMFNHTNLKYSCDHKPGEYQISNYVPHIPSELPPGDYRGEYSQYFEDECIGKIQYNIAWIEI
ncbi:uncharacterized protein LOC123290829 [Chrysoperla carnea]|uniref:uncharacterized protein LOC123290829 n=1 Tax=Chrysoperla carnea TaxID=189513 RepID=UPI001D0612F0|nr:uncharacterized protein LOC123290829 [Chrysoperla carnea]